MKKYLLHIIAVTLSLLAFSGSLFAQQVTDIDGNVYNTVTIGAQTWMAKNLAVTHFRDGTNIPNVTNNTDWGNLISSGYCWYNNDFSTYKDTYGALYNWYSCNTGNLCPTGWHFPSSAEWAILTTYLGGDSIAGGKLKETGTTHWTTPNIGATNETGFTALPAGGRDWYGGFSFINTNGYWWTSSELDANSAYFKHMVNNLSSVGNLSNSKQLGFSVRCLSNGLTATINGTTTVCQNAATPIITFTGANGTAPYTFTYTINSGSNQIVTTTSGNSVTVSVSTGTAGTYTYSLVSVQDANTTLPQTGSAIIAISPLPTANAGAAVSAICQGGTSAALGGSVGGSATGGIWSTPAGGTFSPNATTLNTTWTPPGTYNGTTTLTLTTTGGSCGTATGSKTITVNPIPAITAMTTTVCSGAGFTVTPVNGTNGTVPAGTTYSWAAPTVTGGVTGGASGSGSAINGTLINPTNTAHTATYTITPISGSCTGSPFTLTVTVNPSPTANAGAALSSICQGGTTAALGGSVGGSATGGTWSTPVGGTFNPNFTTLNAIWIPPVGYSGTATLTLTTTGGSCGTASSSNVQLVNPLPAAPVVGAITQPTCALATGSVVLSGLPASGTWTLTSNPGGTITTGTGTSATISGLVAGTYTFTVASSFTTCTSVASENVVINAQPATPLPTAYNNGPVCMGSALNLTCGPNEMASYTWTGPDGFNSSVQNPVVSASATAAMAGTYTLTVISSNGCQNTATTTVTVNILPQTTASNNGPICQGSVLNLIGGSAFIANYSWTGPSGFSSNLESPTVSNNATIAMAGIYTLTETSGAGCKNSASTTVVVNQLPTATISGTTSVCLNGESPNITFTGANGTAPYTFTYAINGSGNQTLTTTSGNSVTVAAPTGTAGTYTYALVSVSDASSTACSQAQSGSATVTVTPTNTIALTSAVGTDEQTKCINTAITNITYATTGATGATVTGLPAGVTSLWAANVVTISGTPTAAGPFTYTVTLTGGCGVITTTGSITVNPNNTVSLTSAAGTNAQTVCINTTIANITYSTTGATGATFAGLPTGVTGARAGNVVTISGSPSVSAGSPYSYTVTLTGGCGIATVTGTITVNPDAIITLTSGVGTNNQTLAINKPISNITYSVMGGGTGAVVIGLPIGVIGNYNAGVFTISGSPSVSGTFNYAITTTGTCNKTATGTITVLNEVINPLIVTNVNDDGIGSLRYAMNYANSTVGTDIITFSIPGYGPFTIQPQTALPTITDPVIIDGYSQPGASATSPILLIEIDGTNAGTGSNGLTIRSGSCTVKGLVINRFAGDGIQITNSGGNIILGNYIGVDVMGESPEGNSGNGIEIINGSSNNKIGGVNFGDGNLISGNKGAGISILSNGATGNLITSNSIYSNGGLGIDLGGNGVTSNDTGDADTGPNNLQNYPVLSSVISSTGSVTINGTLNSGTSKAYNLQFFASKLADGSGYGEGQNYLGSNTVTTDGSGNASFNATFSITSSSGTVITVTATDPLGNTSEFSKALGGFQDQKLGSSTLRYTLNADGVPNITDGSDLNAVRAAFATWAAIPTAAITFTDGGTTSAKYANANDGVNLVSFEDDQFPFSYGVLAVAAKTLKIDPTTQVAQIIDADIVVNPEFVNSINYSLGILDNAKNMGYFDIQSVLTHEIGHVLGLLHSGVVGATMFYTMGSGTKVRTLEQDDISWASYGYPSTSYNTTYGSISGNITYGYGGQPVAGAIVYAISTSRQDSVHAYSDAQGNYLVPGLIPGSYYIYIEPLDGNVNGYNLRPGNISPYIYANTIYTDYPGEFYSGTSESSTETTDTKSPVSVSAGKTTQGINLITNKDLTPPFVVKARATDVSGSLINILSNFSIRFSEPVDETTLSTGTCYLSDGTKTYGGSYTVLGDSVNVVMFDPDSVLKYSTVYTLHVTGGVKDLKGNLLQPEFTQSFTTISKDNTPPQVNEVIPANGATNVFITDNIKIFFSEPMNKTSVEKGFTLTDAGVLKTVSGTFNWDTQNMSVIFTPLGSLREGTTYTIRLPNSISDLSGNKMVSSSSVSFTTVPQAAPTISYFGPVYGSTGVPVTTPVVVDFSEPINTYLINSSTFEVFMGTTPVQGTFEFLNENSRVVFRPSSNLNFSQTYTVILTAGIMDVSQPSLSLKNAPITNTFTTAPNATVSDILYLDPASGVAGAEVTIAGSGFDPNPANNTITFNGFSAPVKTATLTTLTTEVPLSATSGPVQVKVNGTASDNTMYFYIIPQSLDPCSNIIANTSTGTKSTHSTDVTPDGAYAYVTNPNEGTVTAVGLNSLQTTSITVGSTPMNIDINPLGTRAYVTNFNSHTVSVIDLVSTSGTYNKVIETIPVGIEPYGIVSTPDGNRVYVANYYSETMSVINVDPSSGGFDHVVANVTTGTKLNNATITPDGAMVLVTGDDGLKIIDSNPKDKDYNGIIANVSSGTKTNGVAVIPDAGLAMITTEEGHVLVVNLHPDNGDYSEAVIANVSTGTKVSDVKASGDAIFVYMTDTNNNQLLVYQIGVGGSGTTNGSAILGLTLIPHNKIPVGNAPKGMVLSAKSDKLYVIDTKASTGNREITTVAICCGPITPAKTIGDLIISIQNMINNGNITKLRGYALIVTLNSALRNINANRPNLAILDLTAFNVLVNTYIKNKQITSAQGNALVISATALINQLKGTKSALSEPSLADTAQVNQGLIPVSRLGVIYPNPFSQTITINYNVAEKNEAPTKVQIMIYDINGKLVESLVDEIMQSGCYTASWNGTYGDGTHAPYGTYFVLFRAGNVVEVGKIMLIKPR